MSSISVKREYYALKIKLHEAIKLSSEWEYSLETKYTEDQQLDIMSMVSYFDNKQRGFGKKNDERHYNNIRNEDVLYKESLLGFEFCTRCLQLRTALKMLYDKLK